MKVTIERANLLRALNHVHRVVERRNTIPILANVLLRAENDRLSLKATDLDLEIVDRAPAQVDQPGSTTVPAHMLYDIVRKLPDGAEIQLDTSEGTTMALRAGRTRFALQMLPDSDFPDLNAGDLPVAFEMPAEALKRLIDRTQFAISTEETRYYLNGIYFHVVGAGGEARLRAVATDGHRLAKAEAPAPVGAEGMPGVIVPRKTVGEIQKLLEDPGAIAKVSLSDAKIRLAVGDIVLTSKLIDGTFPDYERVIPRGNNKVLTLEKADFERAVDRVSTISSDRGRAVKLTLADDRMVLAVNNPDSGSASDELPVDYDSEPLEIGFNSRYLLDIAAQLTTDEAEFRLADPGSPTLIQDKGESDALYVLMPMRV
ncbi:DNA polymerase III subunit beta [Propylenella binzhouense]|uniref:Beta sliding clamp n=1 Tax=Propylenella binzhouense TaxID=2555902 RepID=A0A964T6E5_9HYPH|nr:DNA polymerase III subunit beta [Propylenella binzhouense]MYZ49333.1 DNA polymerase III subunit beta [Propylenella binzhouense]